MWTKGQYRPTLFSVVGQLWGRAVRASCDSSQDACYLGDLELSTETRSISTCFIFPLEPSIALDFCHVQATQDWRVYLRTRISLGDRGTPAQRRRRTLRSAEPKPVFLCRRQFSPASALALLCV